jgi:hypothetical protein
MQSKKCTSILSILASTSLAIALASSVGEGLAKTKASSYKTMTATIVSRINEAVVTEFRKAWRISGGGSGEIEGAVLLYQTADGAISARSLGQTNQRRRFTIVCDRDVIAIVHTHPNRSSAQPEGGDLEIADHLRIPVFTITNRGMYVYDPGSRKISRVQDGLNWLDSTKWMRDATLATKREY